MVGFTAPGATGHLLTFLLIALPCLVDVPQGFSLLPGGHPLISLIHLAGLLQVTICHASPPHQLEHLSAERPLGKLGIQQQKENLVSMKDETPHNDLPWSLPSVSLLMPPPTVSLPSLTSADIHLISELVKPVIPLWNHLQAPAALAGLALPPPLLLCLGFMTKCEDDSRSTSNRENALIS
ncbi:hypothetical protein CPB84DRAFT_1854019 [Gymnopilus junonius]|uniref:Uncharacterized protein n=1 Tax=Gymnopilus junonius TaxID=109634 RepID=A0A9P5N8B1_GYMJU|nr:hypothetical protein CPB84DRAFT_1854019 [Gymnopilus junonius]